MKDEKPREILFSGTYSWRSLYSLFWGGFIFLFLAVIVRLLVANVSLMLTDPGPLRVVIALILVGATLLFGAIVGVIAFRAAVGRVDKQIIDRWGIDAMIGMYHARIPWHDIGMMDVIKRFGVKRYDIILSWRAPGGNLARGIFRVDAGFTQEECDDLFRTIEEKVNSSPVCLSETEPRIETEPRWTFEGGCFGGVSAAIAYFIGCSWVQAVLADESIKNTGTRAVGMAVVGAAVGMASGVFIKPIHAAILGAVLGGLPMFAKLAILGGELPRPLLIYLVSLIVVGSVAGAAGSRYGEWISSKIHPEDSEDDSDE